MNIRKNFSSMFFLLVAAWILALPLPTTPAWAQGVAQQQVDLSSAFNISGIYTDGTPPVNGGLDGGGAAFSSIAMAATAPGPNGGVNPPGTTSYPTLSLPQAPNTIVFNFGPTNSPNAVSGCTPVSSSCTVSAASGPITLPAGEFTVLELIGTGVQGGQNGTVTVTYTDGSSDNFTQGFSDWFNGGPGYNIGEAIALKMPYRLSGGAVDNRNFRAFNYALALNAAKTVQSLTLPNNRNIVILAATVVAIPGYVTAGGAATPPAVSAGSSSTAPVTVTSEAGYSGTVTLGCALSPPIPNTGATTAPTCTFNPTSVTVGVGAPGSSTLTFTPAKGKSAAMFYPRSTFYALWLPIPGLALVGFGMGSGTRRKKLRGLLLLGMLLAGLLVTPACVSTVHLGNVGTPPGQYTLSITGTDANGVTQFGAGGSVTVTVQ